MTIEGWYDHEEGESMVECYKKDGRYRVTIISDHGPVNAGRDFSEDEMNLWLLEQGYYKREYSS